MKSDHMLMILEKPLTRVLPELHEELNDNSNNNGNNNIINNNDNHNELITNRALYAKWKSDGLRKMKVCSSDL